VPSSSRFAAAPPRPLRAGPPTGPPRSTIDELREGWRLFRGTTWLWVVVVAFGLLNAIGVGAWLTLGPALAGETICRQAWGWVLSAEAAHALVATVVLLRVALPRPLLLGMVAVSLLGSPMVALGLGASVATLVLASFVAGIGLEVFGMGWSLAMQENVDETPLSCAYPYDALRSYVAIPWGSSSTARSATGSGTPRSSRSAGSPTSRSRCPCCSRARCAPCRVPRRPDPRRSRPADDEPHACAER